MKDTNEINIDGIITVPNTVDADAFWDQFVEWIESKGYTFGGSIGPYKDDEL